ncbi:MAG: DinB family protein [Phycisphaerales bacterium]|jgi:hypothetical protein|nr:DinB family protein [Phycisphaerales bacterium]
MLANCLTTYRFSLHLLSKHLEGMTDAELRTPIAPGHHCGLWVLGHLVFAANIALMRIGAPHSLPDERKSVFGPGSDAHAPIPAHFTKDALLAELLATPALLEQAFATTRDEALDKPHGLTWLEGTPVKTLRDSIGQLLTYHAGYHIGQLSVYRRATGKPALF